jgi:hypothetical protein
MLLYHTVSEGSVMVIEKAGITDKESFLQFWLTYYDSERIERLMNNKTCMDIVQHLRFVKGMDEYEAWHNCFRIVFSGGLNDIRAK